MAVAGLRGWYLSDPDDVVPFPKAESYGSLPIKNLEEDLELKSEKGKTWTYKQSRHRQWELDFILTKDQLQFFRDLHDAVEGRGTPFYFVEDLDDVEGTSYYVKKEKDFNPSDEKYGAPEGVDTEYYEYTLFLTQEPTEDEIGV